MIETFFIELGHTLVKFLYAPLMFPRMFWILFPVVLAIMIMELYFWRYPRLNIEYHKSMENSIFLLFVSFDLLRYVAMDGYHNPVKVFVSFGFIVFNALIALLDFYHKLPISLFSKLSSKFVIAFFSYILIALIYSDMLDTITALSVVYILLSVLVLFILIVIVRRIFMVLEPKSYEEIESFLNVIDKDLQKAIVESKENISGKIIIRPPKKLPDLKKVKSKKK
jgi:hypothetical protein